MTGLADPATQLGWLTLGTLTNSTGGVTGSRGWTFSAADHNFDYLAAGEKVTLTYTIQVDDHHGGTTTQNVAVTVTGTNDAPEVSVDASGVAGSRLHAINERTNVTGDSADLDSAGGSLAFRDVDLSDTHTIGNAQPAFGWLDSNGHPLSLTLNQQGALTSASSLTLTPHDSTGTGLGSVDFSYRAADNSFDFLAAGEKLTITYDISVTDEHNVASTEPVTITVTGSNDTPVITSSAQTGAITEAPDTVGSATPDTASGTITFTDVDLSDTHDVTITGVSPSGVMTGLADPATQLSWLTLGTLTNFSGGVTGSRGWTFSAADQNFDYLAAGETVTLTYTIEVDDHHGGTTTQNAAVTVTGTDDEPVITSGAQTGAITEAPDTRGSATPDTASGTITFTDVDLSDTHDVTITGVSPSGVMTGLADPATQLGWLTLGTLTDSTGGVTGSRGWTFSAADHNFDYLAAGEKVTLTYTIEVDDHHGGTTTQNVAVTVTGTNDAPEVSVDASGVAGSRLHAINERTNVTGDSADLDSAGGSLAFRDVDLSDTHTIGNAQPAFGWLDLNGHPLSLTLNQQGALTSASSLTLTPHDSTGTGLGSVDFSYRAADNSFDFLAAGEKLTITYDISVTDEHNVASTEPVTITVTGSNDTPVAFADSDIGHIIEAGNDVNNNVIAGVSTATGDVLSNDTDVDISDTHSVIGVVKGTVSGVLTTGVGTTIVGTYGSLVLNDNGTWTYTLDNTNPLTDALAQGTHASDIFSYTESDHHGGASTTTLTIDVTGTNDRPTLDAVIRGPLTDSAVNDSFATITGTLVGHDVDSGETATLRYAGRIRSVQRVDIALAGLYGSFTVNANGTYSYVANAAAINALQAGSYTDTFTVQTTDIHGASGTATLTVDVTGANDTPAIVGEANAPAQAVMVVNPISPVVLIQGVNTNSLSLATETFDSQSVGSSSNNGAGHGNFHSAVLDANFTASGNAGIVNGSSSVTAAPFFGPLPGSQDTTNYLSIGAGGTETITFTSEKSTFGLYWGSLNSFNTIKFYDGTTLVASYSGADIIPLFPNGNQGSFASNGYVEFSGLHSFDKVVLGTGNSNAFEIDNISAGSAPLAHTTLGAPITGTLSVHDRDIGDTLTASVIGNATIDYNGLTAVPGGIDVSALVAASDITFDSVPSDGGTDVLHWSYHPTSANLDFLHAGDVLKINFTAAVSDGHVTVGSQPLTVTLVGANSGTSMSTFSAVNGTSGNDNFSNVGGNVTIFGGGGQDTFVFNAGFGKATIADFDIAQDTINISHTLFGSVADILAAATSANSGHDTVITDSAHDAITFSGVTVAQLHASNFHLI